MVRRSPLRLIVIYTVLGLWGIVCLFPVYWLASTSIKSIDDIDTGPRFLPFLDYRPTLRAWDFILFDSHENLVTALFNSGLVAVVASGLAMLLGGIATYGLTRFSYSIPGFGGGNANRAIMWGMLATRVIPPVVLVIPVYMMARMTGTLDTPLALIVTYVALNIPVAVWLLQPVLGSTASEQEEAAWLEGASHRMIFFTIVAPMAAEGIAAAWLLVLVLCWNEYLLATSLVTSGAMTLPVWLEGQMSIKEAQIGAEAEELANFSAVATLMIMPLIAFAGVAQRVITRRSTWKA